MAILDFFRPTETMKADEARRFLDTRHREEYHLVDVRQRGEYEKGHLPGALHIPMAELEERQGEIDPERTILLY